MSSSISTYQTLHASPQVVNLKKIEMCPTPPPPARRLRINHLNRCFDGFSDFPFGGRKSLRNFVAVKSFFVPPSRCNACRGSSSSPKKTEVQPTNASTTCARQHPGKFGWNLKITQVENWLKVSNHLKNMSQNGNLPQIGVKMKHIFEQPARKGKSSEPKLHFFVPAVNFQGVK